MHLGLTSHARRALLACLVAVAALLGCSDDSSERAGDASAPDAADLDQACGGCSPDETCVHFFDGTCLYLGTECKESDEGCAGTCTESCDQELCGAQFSCQYACVESPLALVCNGP